MNELKAPSLQSLLGSDRDSTESLLAESLLDFEELDDVEFSIPPTTELPTLEAVLSEFEGDSDIASELGVVIPTPTPSIHEECSSVRLNTSGNSTGGISSTGSSTGSIMRYAMLQGISTQISSASDRTNAGLAASCAVCQYYYAVGTSYGHILNFDVTQTLRWAHQDKHGQGAVTSLAYNVECNRLLAGFARGLVLMLDTHTGDGMRQLFDAVTPNTGVLHVKWTSKPAMALVSDSGGSVWSLNFTRKLGVRGCSANCLFSGARGEVCAIEPLISQVNERHDLDQYCIVALATLSKYFIITVRPRLKVIKYHLLPGPSDYLPVMAWQRVLIQAADTTRSVDPVLVVGRGQQIFFHQLFLSNGRLTFLLLRHISMPENLLSVHWLGPKCVGCFDTLEILHLMDVRSSKEIECIDLANAGVVYGSAQFKGLATGGNVSPALALAGTHACYNSLASKGSHLFILGSRTMHSISVRTWMERITYLVKNQRWQEACDLALDGYKTAADKPKRRHLAKERVLMLFKEYIAASSRVPDYCLAAIMKCIITIGEMDLLWSQLWDRLPTKGGFLQQITEHIQNDNVKYIKPHIAQALVDYWLMIDPSKLEDVILKLDWTCLDLDQILKAAKKFQLYRAQIYLNTTAMNDYTISLIELIPLLSSVDSHELGNCLLVYISSCLAGRSYPNGNIPIEQVPNVRLDVLNCLTSARAKDSTNRKNSDQQLPYPYLRSLLHFDIRETLNVISLAFQEDDFCCDLGQTYRQHIVNIMLEIMTSDNTTWSDIGCLLNFIAQQICQEHLQADRQLLERLFNYITMEEIENETMRMHNDRENGWYDLLTANYINDIRNYSEQLHLARRARCYYVEEYLLEKLQYYDEILACYIKNPSRQHAMFSYIERYAHNSDRLILKQVLRHLNDLLDIDAPEITRLIILHFREHLDVIWEQLDPVDSVNLNHEQQQKRLLQYLRNLHERKELLDKEYAHKCLELLCKYDTSGVDSFIRQNNSYSIDWALDLLKKHEHFIDSCVYLAEKQSNYRMAFDFAMKKLKSTTNENDATECMHVLCDLCTTYSKLPAKQIPSASIGVTAAPSSSPLETERIQEVTKLDSDTTESSDPMQFLLENSEKLWFELIEYVLQRQDLKSITKSLLQEASMYVNLQHLVQLVLNIRHVSGNFGDIKDLLMGMLLQSRQEMYMMEETLRIMGHELSEQFHKTQKTCRQGIWVTMMRCVLCSHRFLNQSITSISHNVTESEPNNTTNILILGSCGHGMHEQCFIDYQKLIQNISVPQDDERPDFDGEEFARTFRCPYCFHDLQFSAIENPIKLAKCCDK